LVFGFWLAVFLKDGFKLYALSLETDTQSLKNSIGCFSTENGKPKTSF
jgi:hypothetical protein